MKTTIGELLHESRQLRGEIKNHLLRQLKEKLSGRIYHDSENYLAFVAASGEPHTVVMDGGQFVVSGSTPKGKLFKSYSIDAVIEHIKTL